MTELWYIAAFALFVMIAPTLSAFVSSTDEDDVLAHSFGDQMVDVDGVRLPASKLQVLYRAPTMRERYGCNTSWVCRSADGAYLLAMAQGEIKKRQMVITWTWRRLTEQRARQAMVHDEEAYRAAFPDQEKGSGMPSL